MNFDDLIWIPMILYQGITLLLTFAFVSLVNFQTARKMMSRPSVLAGQLDWKILDLYYSVALSKANCKSIWY